jgi:hypothetical protein
LKASVIDQKSLFPCRKARKPYGPAIQPLQSPNKADSGLFSKGDRGFALDQRISTLPKGLTAAYEAVAQNPRIYILLCMFNGFAFARPFCGAIKDGSDGV